MSYLLVREDKPPFVLTMENAHAYFDIFTTLSGMPTRTARR